MQTTDTEYTLMAPSNWAFDEVSGRDRQRWRNQAASLRRMLLNHIVAGGLPADSLANDVVLTSLAGSQHRLRINVYDDGDQVRQLRFFPFPY